MRSNKIRSKAHQKIYVGGIQIYGNLYDVDDKYIINLRFLEHILKEAVKTAGMHILKVTKQRYKIRYGNVVGVSIIALLAESHIVLHTWPEGSYVTIDIFSCGKKKGAQKACKYIISSLKPSRYELYEVNRGHFVNR